MGNYNLFRFGTILLVLGIGNYIISSDKVAEYRNDFISEQTLSLELSERFDLYQASVSLGIVMFFLGLLIIGISLITKKRRIQMDS